MALGANPVLLAENRDRHFTQKGEEIYWNTRRQDLMDRYWKAVRTSDEAARDVARQAIDKYNADLPYSQLRITGKDLAQSMKARRKANRLAEQFGTNQRRMREPAGDVRDSFEGE